MQLDISIAPSQHAARVFKLLRSFEPAIELGATIQAIRAGLPVLSREIAGINSEIKFNDFLALIDAMNSEEIQFTLTIVEREPVSSIKERPQFVRRAGTRDDILNALKNASETAAEQKRHAARVQAWFATDEGKRYAATRERLSLVRNTLESRWQSLGYEHLTDYERDYINVWWLCVEVDTGAFDQYFFNSYSDNALATLSALDSIAAPRARAVLVEALSVFDSAGGFQTERAMRWQCLDILPEDAFKSVTEKFYELDEDLRSLALFYVERGYERDMIPIVTVG